MYHERFGTDWEELDLEIAIGRAFALGIMASVDCPLDEEWDRILDTANDAYEKTLLETAYQEGYNEGKSFTGQSESADDVWMAVTGSADWFDGDAVEEFELREAIPGLIQRLKLIEPPRDDLSRFRLPGFLTK